MSDDQAWEALRRVAFEDAVRLAQMRDPETGKTPTAEEIAKRLGVSTRRVVDCKAFYDHPWGI
jgi:hypothetical protein